MKHNIDDIEVVLFHPYDWDRYKKDLMELEWASFDDPALAMATETKQECMTAPSAWCYIALHRGRVVGETYGNVLQEIDEDFFDGHWNPETYRHYDEKTLYITSTAVLPEYRGIGIAKKLKYEMFFDLKFNGFLYAIGHSHEGEMTKINEWFNGVEVEKFDHWYGSEQTHVLMEVDLYELPILFPFKHLKQLKEYDCGIASLCILGGQDKVFDLGGWDAIEKLSPEIGISHEHLIHLGATKHIYLQSKYNCSINDLIACLIDHGLAMVNYQSDGEGHYSVVFGFDREHIYLWDVHNAKEQKIKKEVFERIWYSKMYGYKWMAWKI